jgi:hypothetical protein
MGIRSVKNKTSNFLFQCLTLGSPLARLLTIGTGIGILSIVHLDSPGLPDLCLWERFLGYCPARGTTHALNAFLHGKWEEAIRYNPNVLIVMPVIIVILVTDILRLKRRYFPKDSPEKANPIQTI